MKSFLCHVDFIYLNQSFREIFLVTNHINRSSNTFCILSISHSIEIRTLLLTTESSNLALFQITRSIQSNFICISCLKCVSALYHVSDWYLVRFPLSRHIFCTCAPTKKFFDLSYIRRMMYILQVFKRCRLTYCCT